MDTLRFPCFLLITSLSLTAQPAVWVAPGPDSPPADWHDPANWEEGVVPDGPDAAAVFPAFETEATAVPGAGSALIGFGDVTLGQLEWRLSGSAAQHGASLTIGTQGTAANLRFEGTGLLWGPQPASFTFPSITVANGSLTFAHSSSAGPNRVGDSRLQILVNEGSSLLFQGDASAGDARINSRGTIRFNERSQAGLGIFHLSSDGPPGSSSLEFREESKAGGAQITLGSSAAVLFGGDSSADAAVFHDEGTPPPGGSRLLAFGDRATAGNALLIWDDPSGQIRFEGQSSAGAGNFSLRDTTLVMTFADDASADRAVVSNHGNVLFADNATAAEALISGYHVIFRDASTAGKASIAPAPSLATSSVEFRDQSSAGAATLGLGKLGRIVFADDSDAGTARVNVSSGASEGLVVIRDNARTSGLAVTVESGGHGRLDLADSNYDEVEIGRLEGVVDVVLGTKSLAFRSSSGNVPTTLAGVIRGAGGLIWDRPSVLTVTSVSNDYTGATRLLQGELRLAGGRVRQLEMSPGTRLTGVGTVSGDLRNAGTVSPGASAGTLTIEGNYEQGAEASLDIELFSPSDYDRLFVTGTTALDGRLNLTFAPGAALAGDATFEFLTAIGGVTGQFASVVSNLSLGAALGAEVVYTTNGVELSITQKPFAGFGSTHGTAALGAHLDATLASSTGSYRALIERLNTLPTTSEVSTALAALTPDRHIMLARDGVLAALAQQAERDRRLAGLRAQSRRGFEAYFEASRRTTHLDPVDGLPAVRSRSGGGTAGAYWRNGDGLAFGLSLSQEDVTLRYEDGGRADTESYVPAATFQYAGDAFFLNATVATGRDDHETTRRIVFPGFNEHADATFSGTRTDLAFTLGRVIRAGDWQVVPQAGLLRTRWKTDDFTETGSTAALAFRNWSATALYARAGVEISRPSPTFTPVLSVSWLHTSDNDHAFDTRFAAGPGATYEVGGRAAERSLLQAGLALEKALGRRAVASLSATGRWGDDAQVRASLSAGVKWVF